jgi:hypothetical protein
MLGEGRAERALSALFGMCVARDLCVVSWRGAKCSERGAQKGLCPHCLECVLQGSYVWFPGDELS